MWQFNKPSPLSRKSRHPVKNQAGVTLIELVIAIVIISIAAVALLQGLGFQTNRNVDPMIQSQAQALAKQYLDEALSRSFFDPAADPRTSPSVNQATAVASASDTTSRDINASNRLAFDNVYEFHNYNQPVQTPDGTPVTNLASFQVTIDVNNSAGLSLGTVTNPALTCPPQILLVTVTVTDPRGQTVSLQGYRTSYFDASTRYGC